MSVQEWRGKKDAFFNFLKYFLDIFKLFLIYIIRQNSINKSVHNR